MADSFSANLRLVKQTDQANTNIWGNNWNEAVIDLAEQAIAGRSDLDVTLSNLILTLINGSPDTARSMFLRIIGTPGADRVVTVPSLNKMYIVSNRVSDSSNVEIRTTAFAGYTVEPGQTVLLYTDPIIGGIVREPFEPDEVVVPSVLPVTNVSFNINNATAGDTQVTARFIKQGQLVSCQLPAISTTISTADFDLVPLTTIPDFLLPQGTVNTAYTACVQDAGVEVDSYIEILAGISTTWQILAADGSAYTAAATRTLDRLLSMWWVGNKDQS